MSLQLIALMCEDIRDEINGAITLVGFVPSTPAVPTALGSFTRMNIFVHAFGYPDELNSLKSLDLIIDGKIKDTYDVEPVEGEKEIQIGSIMVISLDGVDLQIPTSIAVKAKIGSRKKTLFERNVLLASE